MKYNPLLTVVRKLLSIFCCSVTICLLLFVLFICFRNAFRRYLVSQVSIKYTILILTRLNVEGMHFNVILTCLFLLRTKCVLNEWQNESTLITPRDLLELLENGSKHIFIEECKPGTWTKELKMEFGQASAFSDKDLCISS